MHDGTPRLGNSLPDHPGMIQVFVMRREMSYLKDLMDMKDTVIGRNVMLASKQIQNIEGASAQDNPRFPRTRSGYPDEVNLLNTVHLLQLCVS
ncbi:hypothetical protein V6N13_112053 [Hibiscus sabdariffa]